MFFGLLVKTYSVGFCANPIGLSTTYWQRFELTNSVAGRAWNRILNYLFWKLI